MLSYKDLSSFSSWSTEDKDLFTVAVIKGLIMDTVRNANSGHTGGPMSSTDFTYILFSKYLNFDPDDDQWFNRDRFILSAGHESALLYTLLTLVGWMNIDDLQNFRQLHSKTPGHPEVNIKGVEATTGPLGQGVAMGIGMTLAESKLRNIFSSDSDSEAVNHFNYILSSDGDLQEPISTGAASLAGHWGLSKVILFYDSNGAQISGNVSRSDSANYETIFEGYGWHVQVINGHDHKQICSAIEKAQVVNKPSIIIGETIMAYGAADMEGDHETHGVPLPQDEIDATKEKLGLPNEKFYLPVDIMNHFQSRFSQLRNNVSSWKQQILELNKNDDKKLLWDICVEEKLPKLNLPIFEDKTILATRKAFGETLDAFAEQLPNLVGGSADLEPSNYTGNFANKYGDYQKGNRGGRNFAFGVREFPMAAILNGINLHGGLKSFGATFLVFSDYERPALRLAAIQKLSVIHEFTHDSFYVGEDGPTHQSVEHAMSLRAIPNFYVFRPSDAKETASCFEIALRSGNTPSALLLTRQGVPVSDLGYDTVINGVQKGAYIVKESKNNPDLVFLATGSEVSLAIAVADLMNDRNIRVVSMPCFELFEEQSESYKKSIIPDRGCMKISMEAGITHGWERYIGINGLSIGIDHYGLSAPYKDLAEEFGFIPVKIQKRILDHLNQLL
ncbi:transketolase [Candidatus Marinimicrobia bacterium]|nr:transketolase [Candidatus Neomarinimicrobiota bacterium]